VGAAKPRALRPYIKPRRSSRPLDKVKSQIAAKISESLQASGLTQSEAALLLGLDQPKVSRLMRAIVGEFSTPRLLHFMTLLGADVDIVIHPAALAQLPGQGGNVRVLVGPGARR